MNDQDGTMSRNHSRKPQRSSIWAMAKQRCPNCKRGFVYRRASARNNLCPACGIRFEREPGYYTGAIYIGILLAFPVLILFIFLLLYFFRSLDPTDAVILSALGLIPLLPVINRISYVIWIAVDRAISPPSDLPPPPPDPWPTVPPPPPRPGGGAHDIPHESTRREEPHGDFHEEIA
jgi:uncharacterized protein (DUF983 family)